MQGWTGLFRRHNDVQGRIPIEASSASASSARSGGSSAIENASGGRWSNGDGMATRGQGSRDLSWSTDVSAVEEAQAECKRQPAGRGEGEAEARPACHVSLSTLEHSWQRLILSREGSDTHGRNAQRLRDQKVNQRLCITAADKTFQWSAARSKHVWHIHTPDRPACSSSQTPWRCRRR